MEMVRRVELVFTFGDGEEVKVNVLKSEQEAREQILSLPLEKQEAIMEFMENTER